MTHGAGLTGQGSRGRTHGAGLTGQDSRGKAHGAGLTGQDSRGNAHWARDTRGRTHGARAHRVFTRADTRSEVHTHRILTRTGSSHVLAETVLSQTVLADRLASVTFVRRSLCTDQPPWYVRTCLGLHPEQESEGESEHGSELVRIKRVVGAHPAVAGHLPWRSLGKTASPSCSPWPCRAP